MAKHTIWGKLPTDTNYLVSIDGDVFSTRRYETVKPLRRSEYRRLINSKLLTPRPNRKGYMRVQLGRDVMDYVHRLVLYTFECIRTYPEFQADHINGLKQDNRLENLDWVTQSENMQRAVGMGLHKGSNRVR